jgi:hypothetical protein
MMSLRAICIFRSIMHSALHERVLLTISFLCKADTADNQEGLSFADIGAHGVDGDAEGVEDAICGGAYDGFAIVDDWIVNSVNNGKAKPLSSLSPGMTQGQPNPCLEISVLRIMGSRFGFAAIYCQVN